MEAAKTMDSLKRHQDALGYAMKQIQESEVAQYVEELYLYGSCSRGDFKWDSDIDLLLVLDENAINYKRDIRILKSAVSKDDVYSVEVDLKVVFGDEWKDSQMLFYENVRRDGKKLW